MAKPRQHVTGDGGAGLQASPLVARVGSTGRKSVLNDYQLNKITSNLKRHQVEGEMSGMEMGVDADLHRVTESLLQSTSTPIRPASGYGPGMKAKPLVRGVERDERGFSCSPLTPRKRGGTEEQGSGGGVYGIGAVGEERGGEDAIGHLSVKEQELLIIDDLLSVLMGLEGNYIDMDDVTGEGEDEGDLRRVVYYLDETLHPSLKELAARILPMAADYQYIRSFIESRSKFEYGYVCHALCAAVRELLGDYLTLLTQLEHASRRDGSFTLHRFWSAVAPSSPSLETLARLARDVVRAAAPGRAGDEGWTEEEQFQKLVDPIGGAGGGGRENAVATGGKGGAILGLLAEGMSRLGGGPVARGMYEHLLGAAAVPWVEMLRGWVVRGEVRDPYGEFMIRERGDFGRERLVTDFTDEYWEKKYAVAGGGAVPRFLRPVQGRILLAGKYLNVLREYGRDVSGGLEGKILASASADEAGGGVGMGGEMEEGDAATLVTSRHEAVRAIQGQVFLREVEVSYGYANRTLLRVLLEEQQLIGRLKSIKRYFLLDQADFVTHFLDLAGEDLGMAAKEVPLAKLQRLMELVLRAPGSVTAADPYKEELRVSLERTRLVDGLLHIINREGLTDLGASTMSQAVEGMGMGPGATRSESPTGTRVGSAASHVGGGPGGSTVFGASVVGGKKDGILGIEVLSLDYRVPFPLSLVISRRAITKYQLLFRHLLQVKYVERLLCGAWLEQVKGRGWRVEGREGWQVRAFALRSRMLWFVQQFAFYVGVEVIEPSWQAFLAAVPGVATVDHLMQLHLDYVDTCLKNCMLTNGRLLQTYDRLMQTCVQVAQYVGEYGERMGRVADGWRGGVTGVGEGFFEQQDVQLERFERRFDRYLRRFVEDLSFCTTAETPQFTCLLVRLEYNLNWRGNGSGRGQ